jgi:hypothetical protein
VLPVEPDMAHPGAGRLVEHHQVETHVHVLVVVDPFRANPIAVFVKRCILGHRWVPLRLHFGVRYDEKSISPPPTADPHRYTEIDHQVNHHAPGRVKAMLTR